MSLLNDASLVLIPSGYKEDKVYSIIPSDGSGDLDFVRGSDGTRINSLGQVENVCWNLLQQSEAFDNAYWFKSGLTITANNTIAPNGTTTADKLEANTTSSSYISETVGFNINCTRFVYAKAGNFSEITILWDNYNGGKYATFNLSNGTVSYGGAGITASIESVGNGWYKCITSGATNYLYLLTLNGATNNAIPSGSFVYIWGAQLNVGSTAKPYFHTTDRLNVPRLTYENGCPSLLLEKQSTNVVLNSENFASWLGVNNITITPNTTETTSPSGINNASKIITGSATPNRVYDFVSTSGGATTLSLFVKAGTNNLIVLLTSSGSLYCSYDLSNQTSNPQSGTTASITPYANGWYRITATASLSATEVWQIVFGGTNGSYLYIWGAQAEASAYPTSYIPTTSTSVTRLADSCSKTGISSLIGQTEGTIFIDTIIEDIVNQTNDPVLLYLKGSSQVYIEITSSGRIYGVFYNGSTSTGFINANVGLTNGRHKIAFAYKTDDFILYLDGIQIGSDTSGNVSGTLTEFALQFYDSFYVGKQKANQALLFKRRLTNTELEQLTTL
jgi:hypothetical protein